MPAYRVGIVGCGARSTAHAAGWVANDGVAIAAVADPIQERRDTLGDKHGVAQAQRYPDFKDMLEQAQLDYISISTKPELREPVVVAAVEAGIKGILCEKPMALSLGRSASHPQRLRRKPHPFGNQPPEASPHRVATTRIYVRSGGTRHNRAH